MTHGNMPEYKLAEKMKSRFSERGAAVSGMRASTTSELMKLAQMGGDPSVNCSELDFRGGANRRNSQAAGYRPMYANPAEDVRKVPQNGQRVSGTATRTGMGSSPLQAHPAPQKTRNPQTAASSAPGKTVRTETAAEKAAAAKESAGKAKANTNAAKTGRNKAKAKKETVKASKARTETAEQASFNERLQIPVTGEITEVKVHGRHITPMFAVFLVIGTMMIMSIVLSFSEIYQTTSEIALLENSLEELKDRAAELELKIEERNDIREIERIATEDLGMVKDDAVQRKYVSLSDGERIDIIEDETSENGSAASGILLSSIWSTLGNLFDYFR